MCTRPQSLPESRGRAQGIGGSGSPSSSPDSPRVASARSTRSTTCARGIFALALFTTGRRADADDLLQTVFVRLAERRASLADVRDPWAYLMAMIHMGNTELRRRRARRPEAALEDDLVAAAAGAPADRRLAAREVSARLHELPEAQREAILLHLFSEGSFAEIGSITGVPTFTAASRYRLGIARLRRLLGVKR